MLHKLHRLSACVLASFILVHLLNHLFAIQGVDAHIGFMESFRSIYRQTLVEALLLGCVLFQVGSGLVFLRRRWGQRSGFFDRLQALSGAYLAFFFLNHVGAVLFGRLVLGLDTNVYYAAAGMHVNPFQYFFVPYYFLAVVAVFGHVACALHWLLREKLALPNRNLLGYGMLLAGAVAGLLIVLALAGQLYPLTIPAEYLETYQIF
ncbi:hypothetical protein MWU49_17200 [Alcanivorax sp. S6407]|uniref:hypothetical protein n=1 Tax=Alcanivorax sp. S6407 TaxID=2926424 RepID=UPI001FF236D3|nr:hypothetical protein [Alcanivorax sp. S6407]MCK0155456.1 hypothetical protein [Alcanivorax sp. S6407]